MTGAGVGDLFAERKTFRAHSLRPIFPVAILDAQSYRAANRLAETNARQKFHAVALNLHAPAAPVSALPTLELRVDEFARNFDARRQSLQNANQPRSVTFAAADKSHAHNFKPLTPNSQHVSAVHEKILSRYPRGALAEQK